MFMGSVFVHFASPRMLKNNSSLPDLEMWNIVEGRVQRCKTWVASEPVVDQSSLLETYISPNDIVCGLLWFLFLWENEDIFEFVMECKQTGRVIGIELCVMMYDGYADQQQHTWGHFLHALSYSVL